MSSQRNWHMTSNLNVKRFPLSFDCSIETHLCCCCCLVGNAMDCIMQGFPDLHYLLEFAQIHVHWVGDVIQPSHPLLPSCPLPSIFPSVRVFSSESALHIKWPKCWSFSFSISLSNEYPGLISFRMDFPLGRTLKSLLKHHSSKASVLWRSAFFMVQLSCLYVTTHPGPPLRGPEPRSSCLSPPHTQFLGIWAMWSKRPVTRFNNLLEKPSGNSFSFFGCAGSSLPQASLLAPQLVGS